jgi:hypothetical protein
MSSACDGNAITTCSTKSAGEGTGAFGTLVISAFAFPQRSPKKAGSSALSGGKIALKPRLGVSCLATRLHNFPGQESFLPGRHFFKVSAGQRTAARGMALPGRSAPHMCCIPRKAGATRTHTHKPPSIRTRKT